MTAPATEQAPQAQPGAGPASRAVEWATVPRVNLLPPEILEGRTFRRVQALLAFAVVLTLALAGAATVWASSGVSEAQADLDAEQERVRALQLRQAQYAEVPRVTAQLDALTSARAAAMTTDVTWYRYLAELRAALPGGVSVRSLNVTMTAAGTGAAGTGTVPLGTSGIGTLSIDGTAPSYDAVSAWLDALDKVAGIDGAALASASRSETEAGIVEVTFSSTAVVADAALSHLFDEGTG